MSGTSAGARRGWKTRKGQLPAVSAGRNPNPIRVAAGKQARRTRDARKQTTMIYNLQDNWTTRMLLRGQISGAQAEQARKAQVAEREAAMRRVGRGRSRKRGR